MRCTIFVILLSLFLHQATNIKAAEKNILFLNSYHNGYFWSDGITEGIQKVLYEENRQNVYLEYLDGKRNPYLSELEEFTDYFFSKYENMNFDLIVTSDNGAIDFVLRNRDKKIFQDKIVVATGISDIETYSFHPDLYLVKEITTFEENFLLMKQLLPKLDTIYFFSDMLRSGLIYREEVNEIMKRKMTGVQLKIIDCFDLNTLPEIVSSIGKSNVIFYSSANMDCNNLPINEKMVAELIRDNASVPIFSGFYVTKTHGFLGGAQTLGVDIGKLTANVAMAILTNPNVAEIPKVTYPTVRYIFDYQTIKHYNIPLNRLPKTATFLNKPISFWIAYKVPIIIGLFIISQLLLIIFFMSRIINNQKKYEKHLLVAVDKAEESDRLKSIFLENVSHEFRTPLNSIIGFSDVLSDEIKDAKQKSYLNIILNNALDLNHLITQVFNFSLLKSHKVEMEFVPVNLSEFIHDICEEIKEFDEYTYASKNIISESDTKFPDHTITTDKHKLKQILLHLVKNAIKFAPNSLVTIGFKANYKMPTPLYFTKELQKKEYVLFYVKDTGNGIPEEVQKIIFEPFRQADERIQNANRGIGLGLSICKSMVTLLGGHIWLDSKTGKGSSFYFTLPQKPLSNQTFKNKSKVILEIL